MGVKEGRDKQTAAQKDIKQLKKTLKMLQVLNTIIAPAAGLMCLVAIPHHAGEPKNLAFLQHSAAVDHAAACTCKDRLINNADLFRNSTHAMQVCAPQRLAPQTGAATSTQDAAAGARLQAQLERLQEERQSLRDDMKQLRLALQHSQEQGELLIPRQCAQHLPVREEHTSMS